MPSQTICCVLPASDRRWHETIIVRQCHCCRYTVDGQELHAKRLSMIAGGTGITPMYQVRLLRHGVHSLRMQCPRLLHVAVARDGSPWRRTAMCMRHGSPWSHASATAALHGVMLTHRNLGCRR